MELLVGFHKLHICTFPSTVLLVCRVATDAGNLAKPVDHGEAWMEKHG